MRSRNLKPEFFTDRKTAALGVKRALIYQALWVLADDGGVCRCDPDYVKGQLFYLWPDVTAGDIAEALCEYYRSARVRLYQISDELYAEVLAFGKHQKPNNPSKFRYPREGQELSEKATVALMEAYGRATPLVVSASASPSASQKLPDDAKLPRRRAGKAKAEAPPNWVSELGDWWAEHIGTVKYGQLGNLAQQHIATRGEDAIKRAALRYFDPKHGKVGYRSAADFFATIAQWEKAPDALTIAPRTPNGAAQPEAPSDRLRRLGAL